MSSTAGIDAQNAWVTRVLGVQLAPLGDEPLSPGQARAQQVAQEIGAALAGMSMAFRKARLSWGAARNAAHASIEKLQNGLRDALMDDPDFPGMNKAIASMGSALEGLDDRLDTALDTAMSAKDRTSQAELKQQALKIISEYRAYVESNVILMRIDTNPFMPLPVHAVLSGELEAMADELASGS